VQIFGQDHVEDYLKTQDCPSSIRGDFSKLTHWRLIAKLDEKREDGSPRSGYYRLTLFGIMFVKNELEVPEYMEFYNGHKFGEAEKKICIMGALRNKFNYNELMDAA